MGPESVLITQLDEALLREAGVEGSLVVRVTVLGRRRDRSHATY